MAVKRDCGVTYEIPLVNNLIYLDKLLSGLVFVV
jgi:hypothetical protein